MLEVFSKSISTLAEYKKSSKLIYKRLALLLHKDDTQNHETLHVLLKIYFGL